MILHPSSRKTIVVLTKFHRKPCSPETGLFYTQGASETRSTSLDWKGGASQVQFGTSLAARGIRDSGCQRST